MTCSIVPSENSPEKVYLEHLFQKLREQPWNLFTNRLLPKETAIASSSAT
jgi:hypothetical protein